MTDTHSRTTQLLDYYRNSILEELKTSALKNINADKNNMVIEMPTEDKLIHDYPCEAHYPHINSELTQMKLQQELDPTKEVMYGLGLIDGYIGSKRIYAPLLHMPCELKRVQGAREVYIKPVGDYQLNLGVIAALCPSSACVETIKQLQSVFPKAPVTKEALALFIEDLKDFVLHNADSYTINLDKNFLILANFGKITSGILSDLDTMKDDIYTGLDIWNPVDHAFSLTSLFPLAKSIENSPSMKYYWKDDELQIMQSEDIAPSQLEVLQEAGKGCMTAIQGGPGTGKTRTILELLATLVANGKTVLVATKNLQALNVLERRYQDLIRYSSHYKYNWYNYLKNGSKEDRKETGKRLRSALDNMRMTDMPTSLDDCLKTLKDLRERRAKLMGVDGKILYHSSKRIDYPIYDPRRLYHRVAQTYFYNVLKKDPQSSELLPMLESDKEPKIILNEIMNSIGRVNQYHLGQVLSNNTNKNLILSMSRLLASDKLDVKDRWYGQSFSNLLKVCPVCFTTISSISQMIPCSVGMFDYVIIDEASQCDIASSLPVLYRAKKAFIVGDDKQLKFVQFLNKNFNEAELYKLKNHCYGTDVSFLDNSKNSLYDFAMYFSDNSIKVLREYFRSPFSLMEWANQTFYNGVLTDGRGYENLRDDEFIGSVKINKVKGAECTKKKACNFKEAERVVSIIEELLTTGYYDGNQVVQIEYTDFSVGVVTPFKAQAELINKMIRQRIPANLIEKHQILVGTAHAFQGSERDVMIASWTVTKNSTPQSFAFINNPNVFNVTVTRARWVMINVVSVEDIERDIPDGYLSQYLEYYLYQVRPVAVSPVERPLGIA